MPPGESSGMANVLNRTTLQYLLSVNTPDYPTQDWVINPDLSAVSGVAVKYWKLTGDNVTEMTQGEKDTVDAALLPAAQLARGQEIDAEVRDYVEGRYAAHRQRMFNALYAAEGGLPDRQDYIQTGLDWISSVLDHFYEKRDEIAAATTLAEVAAVTTSLAQFDATDPKITIEAARAFST